MSYADREKQQAAQLRFLRSRREEWLRVHGPCAHCGSTERLEVDHLDPAAKISHRVWSWSAERRERELAGCQVLCRACHVAKHRAEMRKPLVHGTTNGYSHHACRCDLCREANAGRAAEQKRRRQERAEQLAAARRSA